MKLIRFLILFFVLIFSTSGEDYYVNTIPGIPIGPGHRIGGTWKKTEPKCDHDLSTLDMLKQESIKNARNWRRISMVSAILAGIALLVWYVAHIPQAGGVAVISVLYSFFATLMSVVVTMTYLIVLIGIVVVLLGIGIALHKKSAWRWFKERKK